MNQYQPTKDIITNWEKHWTKRQQELGKWTFANMPHLWELEFQDIIVRWLKPTQQKILTLEQADPSPDQELELMVLEERIDLILNELAKLAQEQEIHFTGFKTESEQQEQIAIFNSILHVQSEQTAQVQINSVLK